METNSSWIYTDKVKEHFLNPKNVLKDGEDFQADGEGITGNVKCGDEMLFLLKIKDDIIQDVRWKTYGCASAIASTSALSELIKGMHIRDAYQIKPDDVVKALGGLPENKIHCSVLGDKALRVAIDNYLEKTGRKGLYKDLGARIICTCLNITDHDIEEAVKQGAHDWEKLQEHTKIGTVCGKCRKEAEELLHTYVHIFGES
ncbi:MAG TPA: iron-sulfur cluster assembly scaffold protein [Spirochaetales bacterium]|nr:iron-sulfur cluster assembly scaffold protein [Spirochaetales bacterium]HQK33995.1 iron-sulfur cluster assembly scaffold protein [Spirochaetales bacterium]